MFTQKKRRIVLLYCRLKFRDIYKKTDEKQLILGVFEKKKKATKSWRFWGLYKKKKENVRRGGKLTI